MIYRLKTLTKSLAGKIGIDVRIKRDPLAFLTHRNIRTVLDIGANEGQFASEVRKTLPCAKIYSFEPLPSTFAKLCARRRADPNFEAVPVALGAESGLAEFEENDFTAASSLLTLNPAALEAWPQTAVTRKTQIRVETLDSWAGGHTLEAPYFVKLDVQGYEDKVIAAGRRVIGSAAVVMSEVSFVEMYKDQPLFDDIHDQMRALGFRLGGMIGNLRHPVTHDILGADAIFLPMGDNEGWKPL